MNTATEPQTLLLYRRQDELRGSLTSCPGDHNGLVAGVARLGSVEMYPCSYWLLL